MELQNRLVSVSHDTGIVRVLRSMRIAVDSPYEVCELERKNMQLCHAGLACCNVALAFARGANAFD